MCSCSSTRITSQVSNVVPLADDIPIEVFTTYTPEFGYEVLCEATVEKHDFMIRYGVELNDFAPDAIDVARSCGAPAAMVESFHQLNANITVHVKGIRRTTDRAKINSKEIVEKLAAAAHLDNTQTLKILFKQLQLNKSSQHRAPLDNQLLDTLMLTLAEKGRNCSKNAMQYLWSEYNVRISNFTDHKTNHYQGLSEVERSVDTSKLLSCPSRIIADSFDGLIDKEGSIREINQVITTKFNYGFTDSDSLVSYVNFRKLYPKIMKEVNQSCQLDAASVLCSAKDNFQKTHSLLTSIMGTKKNEVKTPVKVKRIII